MLRLRREGKRPGLLRRDGRRRSQAGLDVRKAALKISKTFNIAAGDGGTTAPRASHKSPERDEGAVLVNEPLNFRLKDLDPAHPYLQRRGFTKEIMDKFGVGFCSKGSFAGRIAIPLHGSDGELIGYAGRVTEDAAVSATNPKYLFPGTREHAGDLVEFRKSLFLYNGWRFKEPLKDLIVVEGFPSVWWLTQCGFQETVAIMGSSCSSEQRGLLTELTGPSARIWIMTDGDAAGRRWAGELASTLAEKRLARIVIADGRQPTDFSREELRELLGG